jgi:hypothetical protein
LKPGAPGPGVGVAVEESRQGSVGTLLEQKAEGVKARDEKRKRRRSRTRSRTAGDVRGGDARTRLVLGKAFIGLVCSFSIITSGQVIRHR